MRHYLAALLLIVQLCSFAAQTEYPAQPDTAYNTQGNLFFGLAAAPQSPIVGAAVPSLAVTKSATGVDASIGEPFGGLDIALSSLAGQNSRVYILGNSQQIPGNVGNTRVGLAAMTQCEGSIDQSFNAAGNLINSSGVGTPVLRPGYLAFAYVDVDGVGNPVAPQIAQRIAVDGNGRIGVVSNWSDGEVLDSFSNSPAVLLINSNGTLDTTVNQNGVNAQNILQVLNDVPEGDRRSPHGVVLSAIVDALSAGVDAFPIDIAFSSSNFPTVVGNTLAELNTVVATAKIYLYRLANNGLLDTTFNSQTNKLQDVAGDTNLVSNLNDGAGALYYSRTFGGAAAAITSSRIIRANNGGYFVAGNFLFNGGTSSYGLITKLTSTGLVDTSFGTENSNAFQVDGTQILPATGFNGMGDGSVVFNFSNNLIALEIATEILDIKELADGSVIAVGQYRGNFGGLPGTVLNGFVVKLTASGVLDTSFNASGSVLTYDGNNLAPGTSAPGILLFSTSPNNVVNTNVQSVCCATDGKIFVTGDRRIVLDPNRSFFVLSLNANGTPDTTFNPNNVEVTYAGALANNASLAQNAGSGFANYLGIYNVAFVENGEYLKCATNSSNRIFIGGPNVDEYLFAFKLRGPGRFVPCPAPTGSFVCALIDKYSQLCSPDCPEL